MSGDQDDGCEWVSFFWYRPTRVVPDQRPLNGCVCVCVARRLNDSYRKRLGPDLQNILRQSYDYLTIMPKLRSTYDGRLIYKTSYNEWKAFHG